MGVPTYEPHAHPRQDLRAVVPGLRRGRLRPCRPRDGLPKRVLWTSGGTSHTRLRLAHLDQRR
eukprot:5608101-Alexandrium_andersonii.AAC.1